ncbi:hypothetical protein [Panacagrimonas sp.]|uniref:hypothetical protein n=1 Tax=Panacagrimonas sp. TaxID=2480088 RepID=UPI003B52EF89
MIRFVGGAGRLKRARLLAAAGVLCGIPALVSASPDIRLQAAVLQETQVASVGGVSRPGLVPASRVTPGSEVIYQVSYTNTGAEPAQLIITNPLPDGLLYQHEASAAAGSRLEVSIDGGAHFGELPYLRLNQAGGQTRAATAADVTHVRWVLDKPLQPGEGGRVSLRAVIR